MLYSQSKQFFVQFLIALALIGFDFRVQAQTPNPTSSAMVDSNIQRSRSLSTKGLDAQPQKVIWKLEKLFSIVHTEYISGSSGPIKFFADIPTHQGYSLPVISDGVLFFTLNMDTAYFFAIEAATGNQLVTLRFDRNRLSAPAVVGETVFFGSEVGRVTAYDLKTRKAKWIIEQRGKSFAYSDPIVEDGTLYICGARAGLFALKTDTGDVRWTFKSDEILHGPTINGDDLFFGSSNGLLIALNKKTGEKKWETKMGRDFSTPAVLDDQIIVGNKDGEVRAYAISDGSLRWKSNDQGGARTQLALSNGAVYYGEQYGNITALDAATGRQKWRFKINRPCREPIVAGGLVYTSCEDRYLYALDAQTGIEKWKWEHKKGSPPFPTFANGIMYLLGDDGLLSAQK